MHAAEIYHWEHKIAAKRNGPLGTIRVDVLGFVQDNLTWYDNDLHKAWVRVSQRQVSPDETNRRGDRPSAYTISVGDGVPLLRARSTQ